MGVERHGAIYCELCGEWGHSPVIHEPDMPPCPCNRRRVAVAVMMLFPYAGVVHLCRECWEALEATMLRENRPLMFSPYGKPLEPVARFSVGGMN